MADYGNVAEEADAAAMIARAVDEWGRFDILLNNAGHRPRRCDLEPQRRRLGCRHACPRARAVADQPCRGSPLAGAGQGGHDSRGRIINTTSGAGLVGNFGQTNYATAKAAVVGLTQTLALELHRLGVTVNAIGPAGATRITGTMPNAPAVVEPDEIPEDTFHPLDPAGSSPVVAWLASDEAQYVTGQIVRVIGDKIHLMGGWHEAATASNDGMRWDATKVGDVFATQIFGSQGRGLRSWSS